MGTQEKEDPLELGHIWTTEVGKANKPMGKVELGLINTVLQSTGGGEVFFLP